MLAEMQIEDIRVSLRMLAEDLLDLRAKLRVREHAAEGRVQDLPAGLSEAAEILHILPTLQIHLLELHRIANIRWRRSLGERRAHVISRLIGVVSPAAEVDDLA